MSNSELQAGNNFKIWTPALDGGASMNVRQMEVFAAIMRTGSVTGAGRVLGISQPAVSKTLLHIEDMIGIPLFLRRGGKLRATPEAEELFAATECVFDNVDYVQRRIRDIRRGQTGSLRVAVLSSIVTGQLSDYITRFLESHPDIDFNLNILSSRELINRVGYHQMDLGILYGPVPNTNLTSIEVMESELVGIVRNDSPFAAETVITPKTAAEARIISFNRTSPWGARVCAAFAQTGIKLRNGVECSNPALAMTMAEAGVGIALLPRCALDSKRYPNVIARPFSPRILFNVHALFDADRRSNLAEAFIEELQAAQADLASSS